MKRLALFAAGLGMATAGLVSVPVSASHGCNGNVTSIDNAAYIDRRGPDPYANWWYYRESNGIPGLQSGGNALVGSVVVGKYADPCNHDNPDTLLI